MTEHEPKSNLKNKWRKPNVNKQTSFPFYLFLSSPSSFGVYLCVTLPRPPLSITDTLASLQIPYMHAKLRTHASLAEPRTFLLFPLVCHISLSALVRPSPLISLLFVLCIVSSSYLSLFICLPTRRPSHVSRTLPPRTLSPSIST